MTIGNITIDLFGVENTLQLFVVVEEEEDGDLHHVHQ